MWWLFKTRLISWRVFNWKVFYSNIFWILLFYNYILILPLFFNKVIYIESILNLHQPSLFPHNPALPCMNSKDKGSVKNCLAIALLTLKATTHTPTSPPPSRLLDLPGKCAEPCLFLTLSRFWDISKLPFWVCLALQMFPEPTVSLTRSPLPIGWNAWKGHRAGNVPFSVSEARRRETHLKYDGWSLVRMSFSPPSQVAAAPRIQFSSRRFWTIRRITQSSAVSF